MIRKLKKNSESGSVLIAVIWILAILSIFTVAVNRQGSQQLMLGTWMSDKVQARMLANAGIARALMELQQDKFMTFDALNEDWALNQKAFKDIPLGEGTFSVECVDDPADPAPEKNRRYGACDESARININEASEMVLKQLVLTAAPGTEDKLAVEISQAIVDWRDGDDAQLQSGAESTYYRGLPAPYDARNKPLESVEELQMIKGIDPALFKQLKPYVTVYSPRTVNANTAPAVVLQALGLSPALAQSTVEFRKGEDGILGTKDDQVFQDVGGITPAMSLAMTFSSEDFASVANPVNAQLLGVKSNTFRIHSVGRLKKDNHVYEYWITCVTKRNGSILYWHEGEGAEA